MADNTKQRDTGAGGLDGGTQGHGSAGLINVGGVPGGTNSVSPQGNNHVDNSPDQRGTANLAKQDAEAAFEDRSRKPSGTEAKQWGRDAANADTTAGTPHGGVESPPGTRNDAG